MLLSKSTIDLLVELGDRQARLATRLLGNSKSAQWLTANSKVFFTDIKADSNVNEH